MCENIKRDKGKREIQSVTKGREIQRERKSEIIGKYTVRKV